MVKKNKNRQTPESPSIQNGGDSGESGDQKKTCTADCRCPHIQKAIQLASIKKGLKNGCLASDCPGCNKDGLKIEKGEGSQSSGLWLCLQCGHQGCGRTENQHALKHFRVVHSDPHCVAVNTTNWNVWCYSCEVELPSEYRKKLQECVKYLKNLDCPASVRVTGKSAEGNKEMESSDSSPMPLTDVTNMPHGIRAHKKKIVSLPRVRGLNNLGNTCFFNSVMQCLAQTPHFLELLQDTRQGGTKFFLPGGKDLLLNPDGKKRINEEDEDDELAPLEATLSKWGTLTETLASVLEELRQDDATAVNPQRLFNKLTAKCPQFAGGDQHDAHELLRHLLDEVRTEDLKRYWTAILDQYGLSRHDTSETVDSCVHSRVRAYGRQAGELQILPDPVFRGILVSTVECQDCLHSYQRTEPFYELSLPVTTNKPQPPVMRRKTGGEDSFDVCGNASNEASGPSKHQLKKERRQQRKGRKKHQQQQKSARILDLSSGEPAITEETRNSSESEQSDADVEDNVDQEAPKEEGRSKERVVNGEVNSPLSVPLCNGNISEKECGEGLENSVNEESKHSQDVMEILDDMKELVRKKKISKNGVIDKPLNGVIEQNGSIEDLNEKMSTEDTLENLTDEEEKQGSPKKKINIKENEEDMENSFNDKSSTVGSARKASIVRKIFHPKGKVLENGVGENCEAEENGNIEDRADENKPIIENGICEQSNGDVDSPETMDTSNDVSSTKDTPCDEAPSDEFSLSISTVINSPMVLGSPMSNAGSPSSVSLDLNVDLSTSNRVPSNNWPTEDTDRPFSRIAFCNDDDVINSSNDRLQSTPSVENSFNGMQKSPSTESGSKETTSSDQLVKEMASLSLGHDECQSPSHWDTCSAHSLDDLKDNKLALPLDVALCNGVGNSVEIDPVEDGDKNGTLAPRYPCEDKECSIESCLNQFTMLELMTGSCKVICESCSERVNKGKQGKMVATNSTKQYLVSNPPTVLVLHLKRFEVYQNMFRKTPRHVTFPMLLDIAPICNTKCRELPTIRNGQTKVLYSLYGVVQHSGTLHGGHYSAYVKVRAPVKRDDMRWCFLPGSQSRKKLEDLSKGASIPTEPVPGKWYHVSDSRVNEVNEDRVLHSQAYLLFYERVW